MRKEVFWNYYVMRENIEAEDDEPICSIDYVQALQGWTTCDLYNILRNTPQSP
jgi:hypothetical protein